MLSSKPRAATVSAVSALTCLQISKKTFESVLGPLQNIIEDDQKRRESKGRKVMRKASIQQKGTAIQDIATSSHFDFKFVGTWNIDDTNFTNDVSIVRHARGKEFNMRRFNKCNTKNQNQGASALRSKTIMTLRQDSNRCISDILATYVDENCLWMLLGGLHSVMCMNFDELILEADGGQVLSEDNAKFYAGCMVNAIESLHSQNILYRMIDSQCIGVDTNGYLVLYDFLLAKDLSQDPRTTTLCGSKEYFAPEQVSSGNGHSLPVDLWALGILICELMNGSTPFQSDDIADGGEKGMYDRIIAHKPNTLSLQSASKECVDFVNKLVVPAEKKRLKHKKLGSHAWFKSFDFDGLKRGTLPAPFADVLQKRMENLYSGRNGEGKTSSKGRSKVTTVPYLGDSDWFDGF